MNIEIDIDGISIDEVGIKTDRTEFTDEEFSKLINLAKEKHNQSKWLIADTAALLEDIPGPKAKGVSKYTELEEATGLSKNTLRGYALCARRIPAAMRKKYLAFGVHVAIAKYTDDPHELETLLNRAESEGMTTDTVNSVLCGRTIAVRDSDANIKKLVDAVWSKHRALRKLTDNVKQLTYKELEEAITVLEPYVQAYQDLRARGLYLDDMVSGRNEYKLADTVAKVKASKGILD